MVMDSHGWLLRTCRRSPKKNNAWGFSPSPSVPKKWQHWLHWVWQCDRAYQAWKSWASNFKPNIAKNSKPTSSKVAVFAFFGLLNRGQQNRRFPRCFVVCLKLNRDGSSLSTCKLPLASNFGAASRCTGEAERCRKMSISRTSRMNLY